MVTSAAKTVKEFFSNLPPDRRAALTTVADTVRARLPPGYEEGMLYGGLCWYVPLSRYPDTYNKQPLVLAGVQAQKQYNAIYLMTVYGDLALDRWFRDAFAKAGKRLDMGKSCVRFKSVDDLPLDVIGEVIARVGVDDYVARVESVQGSARKTRGEHKQPPAAKKKPPAAAKKPPAAKKKPAKKQQPAASARARRR